MTSLQRLFRFIACTSCRAKSPTDGAGLTHSIFEDNRKGIKSALDNQGRGEMEMHFHISYRDFAVCNTPHVLEPSEVLGKRKLRLS